MTAPPATQADPTGHVPFAPGVTVLVRDEEWLVTAVERAAGDPSDSQTPYLLRVRGLSPYVRDITATFYTDLDRVTPLDPSQATVKADASANYRRARLWLESTLRRTPVPLYDESLVVSRQMLADHLDYQLSAVRKALSTKKLRPRLLIADAVGFGKTLEIGMILGELIRRGRGDRIFVVTPRHVLEQMQQELWCRFAIPLVRLDSVGIQKVRRTLPATRNPFTFFPRVIVSIHTLKSPKYKAYLEKVRWDAVVIDEVHNATNASTQNNELARILAPTTEALLLTSATPHNGRSESFAEILALLDPTVVRQDGSINRRDKHIRQWRDEDPNASIGVLTHNRRDVERIIDGLEARGISVTTGEGSGVHVLTMHSSKGMEFTHVVLARVSEGTLPSPHGARGLTEEDREQLLRRERSLLYVAGSRARDQLVVNTGEKPSSLLPQGAVTREAS